jgi:hypothetical protein
VIKLKFKPRDFNTSFQDGAQMVSFRIDEMVTLPMAQSFAILHTWATKHKHKDEVRRSRPRGLAANPEQAALHSHTDPRNALGLIRADSSRLFFLVRPPLLFLPSSFLGCRHQALPDAGEQGALQDAGERAETGRKVETGGN